MKIKSLVYLVIALIVIPGGSFAQDITPPPENMKAGFDSITPAQALAHVAFLASDQLEGRDTASHGMRIAREYAATQFSRFGLTFVGSMDSYHQFIEFLEFEERTRTDISVVSSKGARKLTSDQIIFSRGAGSGTMKAEMVFLGYGIEADDLGYNDFADIDIEGKVVVVMAGQPFADAEKAKRFAGFNKYRPLMNLHERGAVAVIAGMEGNPFGNRRRPARVSLGGDYIQQDRISSTRRYLSVPKLEGGSSGFPTVVVKNEVIKDILSSAGHDMDSIKAEIDKNEKPNSFELNGMSLSVEKIVPSEGKPVSSGNVIGMVEGSDPELKDEFIVIGAHMDHVGMNEHGYVFNGADDNATGSAGVLELAEAFATNPIKPKRSIIFCLWTGEEKGLYGSRYFVRFPPVPLEKIKAYFNMDMIGRNVEWEKIQSGRSMFRNMKDLTEDDLPLLTRGSVSAQAEGLLDLMTSMNQKHIGLKLAASASAEMSGGSDHAPFHGAGIPAFSFISGLHDDYHQSTDTVEKINADKMAKTAQLIYLLAFNLADMDEVPAFK
jgi:hypothetical protein